MSDNTKKKVLKPGKEELKSMLFKVLDYVKKGMPIQELCQKLEIDKDKLFLLIGQLRETEGYEIQMENGMFVLKQEADPEQTIRVESTGKKEVKILLISDTDFGKKGQQNDLLATACKKGEEQRVDFAIHCGNLCAGRPTPKTRRDYFLKGDDRRAKSKSQDISSFEKQLNYLIHCYPRSSFKTYFVAGPRDLTFKEAEGRSILKSFCAADKERFFYCGDNKAVFVRQDVILEVLHAKPGAEPYTKSYEIQGIGGKNDQNVEYMFADHTSTLGSDIIILGGRHVGLQIPVHNPREKGGKSQELIEVPSLAKESPSEKVKNILAGARTLGFGILTLSFFSDGSLKNTVYEWYDLTAYQRENNYLESNDIDSLREALYAMKDKLAKLQEKFKSEINEEEKKKIAEEIVREKKEEENLAEEINLLAELIPMPRKLGYLSREFNFSSNEEEGKKRVQKIIERLRIKGYKIVKEETEGTFYWERTFRDKFMPVPFNIVEIRRFALKSDDHIGNQGCREDLLKEQYEIAEKEKCEMVFDGGDIFDGTNAYKGQPFDLNVLGADAQREHGLKIWPITNIPTCFIAGSAGHEYDYWKSAGHDIVKTFVEDLRKRKKGKNLYFYTNDESRIVGTFGIGKVKVMLRHPTGGAPKGRSYRPQEIVSKLLTEIEKGTPNDVHVVGLGHLHMALFMLYKGLAVFLIPCIEEISDYLQGKTLIPDLGMWVTDIGLDERGNTVYVKNQYFAFKAKKTPILKVK